MTAQYGRQHNTFELKVKQLGSVGNIFAHALNQIDSLLLV